MPSPSRRAHRTLSPTRVSAVVAIALGAAAVGAGWSVGEATSSVDRADWLGIVNAYRSMSGVPPIVAEPAWTAGAQAHSCYMIANDISHAEIPGQPGYSPEGHEAGVNGNVAVSGSVDADARSHIDLWMTGPFHAIGVLRPTLTRSAYGECEDANAPRWRSAATLDVLRGIDPNVPRPAEPVLFPGDGATVPLYRFVVESPDPLAMCGWAGPAGLPLLALMPGPVGAADATLHGPSGPVETCVLHAGNVTHPTARAILEGDQAVIVIPRVELSDGAYAVSLTTDAGGVAWSFNIDRNAPLAGSSSPTVPDPTPPAPPPEPVATAQPAGEPAAFEPTAPFRSVDTRIGLGAVRLTGETVTRIQLADPDVSAVSANFVAVGAAGPGYLTAYNCTGERPLVSTLAYQPGQAIANQAVVPLDGGALCLFTKADVDVVIDVNGVYRGGAAGNGFHPLTPMRVYDTRAIAWRMAAYEERSVQVSGVAAPVGAQAVALNVTAVGPDEPGYVQVYPCGAPTGAEISTINYLPGDVRPNSAIVPVDADGRVCVRTKAASDVIIDITGYFGPAGLEFQPFVPLRLFDSRATEPELNAITGGGRPGADSVLRIPIAGQRGVPADARAVTVNLTAVDVEGGTFLTAFPCGERPEVSNLNIGPGQLSVANGAVVELAPDGALCVYTKNPVHVIVDVNGVWLDR